MKSDRPRFESWDVTLAVALLAVAGVWACVCDLALVWDGGAHFCYTLVNGEAYMYAARFFSAVLWQPVVWAAHVTRDLAVLRFLFGLPLCVAPAVAAALSWWMVRHERPALFPWALLGICAAAAPAQVFMINESTFQQTMFWPALLGLLVPLDRKRGAVVVLLLTLEFSHPQGLLLLAIATLMVWRLGAMSPSPETGMWRRRVPFLIGATLLCFLRVVMFRDPYAAQEANVIQVVVLFWQGIVGWPLLGWMCLVLAVWWSARAEAGWGRVAISGAVVLAALCWWYWAADPQRWWKALDARRFVVPLAAPFYFGAWRAVAANAVDSPSLRRVALASAVIFAGVLGLQATGWRSELDAVLARVERDPRTVIPTEDFADLERTPLGHWGLGSQVIAKLGGRKLVLDSRGRAALFHEPPWVVVGYDAPVVAEPGPLGWFEFRETVRRALAELSPR